MIRGAEENAQEMLRIRGWITREFFFSVCQLRINRWQTTRKVINGDFPHALFAEEENLTENFIFKLMQIEIEREDWESKQERWFKYIVATSQAN